MSSSKAKRNANTDIILVLKPIDGAPKSTAGLVDRRLFSGDNTLHAKMNLQTCLWHMEYDKGLLPNPLHQQFTSFQALLKHARQYFLTRNIEITEIID